MNDIKSIIYDKLVEFLHKNKYFLLKYHDYNYKSIKLNYDMKPLKIYLGDLTYDTVAVSTEAMPLNVGFIASYCKSRFGSDVEIKIFKYINKLDDAIHNDPPHILALSNYCWSYNLGLEMFRMMKLRNPDTLTVFGGPNFPIDLPSQEKFMNTHHEVDIYVPTEGEVGFSNIVERALKINSTEKFVEKILSQQIDNCIIRGNNGKLQYAFTDSRIKALDNIPSPYLTGLLDDFFDGKLTPMLQTNRGCPFTCTFCTDGRDEVNQVNKFSPERVKSELCYIAEHVPENTHTLYISDLNFGMIPGDIITCDAIVEIQKKYNYPHKILSTTGKNNKEKIIESIKRLNGTLALSMSVQSMDEQVLTNIRRPNISVEKMMALAPTIKEYDLRTTSELILGLPGETYKNHIEGLRKLVAAQMDYIVIHTCMLLPGSEMAIPSERKKWNFKTKFRILPRDFAILSNNKKVCEIEEIVVGSNSMTFDEYLESRILGFVLWVTNQGVVYDSIIKLLRENNVDVFELFHNMLLKKEDAPDPIKDVMQRFKQVSIDELWDSPEEILTKIQDDDEYQKLLDGRGAINVVQYHHALVLTEFMDDWTEYTLHIAHNLLKNTKKMNEELEKQFLDVANYCRGISHNPLKKNRMLTNPKYFFKYNISKWLDNTTGLLLREFELPQPVTVTFVYTEEQNKIIQDNLDFYGDNLIGKTKALKAIPFQMLWRHNVGFEDTHYESLHIRDIEAKRWNTI